MATLQVRSIDDRLYKALGKRALMDNRSISQEVVMIIKQYLSTADSSHARKSDALLELAGSWQDERSADKIIGDIRKSRRDSGQRFTGKI